MNLEEVAKRARVSTATVSRVLNNASIVKSSTRSRVMKAVEALNYHPNLQARSLAKGKSRSIGVIVSNIENPFFLDIYKAVEAGAHAQGYELIMANTDYRSDQLVTSIRLMIGRRVAGLAAIVSEMDPELIDELNGHSIPVVFYDVGAPRGNITNIRVNYRRGMETLADYLYNLGHRRMGFVGHHATLGPITERANVLLETMSRHPGVEVQTAADMDSLEGGRRATRTLLSANSGLTAIVCVNDFMAVGAMREIRERGLRVPEDISVTGFDNVKLAQFCYPALTSVHIPRDQIGQIICDSLLPGEKTMLDHDIVIDPELVVRDSTGPAAGSRNAEVGGGAAQPANVSQHRPS
jgi:DNA-binding LacI/PurR family transcriptional regulator